jgi:hypothetical protein
LSMPDPPVHEQSESVTASVTHPMTALMAV